MHKRTWPRLALLGVVVLVACDSPMPPEAQPEPRPVLATAIVSNPVPATASASLAPGLALRGNADAEVVYVSLPPGTLPDASEATVRNPHTGSTVTVPMTDGGFDPVAVAAAAGDTLQLDVRVTDTAERLLYGMVVPPERPPVIVRTDPPPKKRDVPLNAVMLVVFSEPVDPKTVTPQSVQLLVGGKPVAGGVTLDAEGLRAELQPTDALVPSTEYQLVVTTGVTDLTGDSLLQGVAEQFTTAAQLPPSGPPAAVLGVQAFTVAEYRYTDSDWNYTPLLRVAETGGTSAATIIGMTFSIPNLGPFPSTTFCPTTNNVVGLGQSLDLISVQYGEYEFAFDSPTRATGDDATVVIAFRDDVGRLGYLRVTGAVVPGDPPTTATAGSPHGYTTGDCAR